MRSCRNDDRILYRESKTWYARYGVSQRIVPEDYDTFLEYWESTIRDDLISGEALEKAIMINSRWHEPPPSPRCRRGSGS